MGKAPRGLIAWISDHPPQLEQTDYLESRGYNIVPIKSPRKGRWSNAAAIYSEMRNRCGRDPDLIVMVLPSQGLGGMFLQLCQNIPVYQAEMLRENGRWIWTGKWSKIEGTVYIKRLEEIPAIRGV